MRQVKFGKSFEQMSLSILLRIMSLRASWAVGGDDGIVVSMYALYSIYPSLNPTDIKVVSLQRLNKEKTKIISKRGRGWSLIK